MKDSFPKKFLFLLLPGAIGLGLLIATWVLAAEMEVPLPGMPKNVTDPGMYIRYLFIFGLSVVGFLAVGMTIMGGIQYMLAGTISSTEKARKTIISALGGVFLLLCSYLLLYTIDPNLVNLSPKPPTPIKSTGGYKTMGDIKIKTNDAGTVYKVEETEKTTREIHSAKEFCCETQKKCEDFGKSIYREKFIGVVFNSETCTIVAKK